VGYNERFVEIWKVPPELMASRDGARLLEHLLPMVPDPARFTAVLQRLRAAPQERWHDELLLVDNRVIERFSGPVPLPDGAGFGRIWMFRDVTDRRRAEDAICELNELLENRIATRTSLLEVANRELDENLRKLREAQAELVQTGKMAAIGTLVAGLSHELNNPINIIAGFSQSLLKRAALDDPSRAALEAIERQSGRCAGLVRALLDFSRRSSSEKPVPTRAERVLGRAAELVGAEARRHGVDLRIAVASELPEIEVCAVEIETAILNLIGNALDATPAGGTVELRAVPAAADARPGIEIAVIDAGAGIPPELLTRIFDPFFTTKPPGKGTGLGLSLTRQIVERHHGSIRVESHVGTGTTMLMWIPAAPLPSVPRQIRSIT
jgi:signal transduction histidine kinase